MSGIAHGTLFNTVLVLSDYSGYGKTYQIQRKAKEDDPDRELIEIPILPESTY